MNLLLLAAVLIASCKSGPATSYAIRDFRKTLQPYLVQLVSKGFVHFDSTAIFIDSLATDKELAQLSRSEHPVLRAIAFRLMLDRPTINHFDLIMNHLDDTAFVATYAGEWGIWYRTVSDDLVEHGRWKDSSAKAKTIDEIIMNHNYLRSAYTGLAKIELTEKYYASIKQMAQREERPFEETEYALYALASFRKAEDVELISQMLLVYNWRMDERSFNLMKDFPDTMYMQVFRKYLRNFYHFVCKDQNVGKAEAFFKAVASYKSINSLQILKTILARKPFMPCPIDTGALKETLYYSIWNNECPAYDSLRKQVAGKIKEMEANTLEGIIPLPTPKDTASEPVYWW